MLCWTSRAWGDYLYWHKTDKAILKRINELIKSMMRTPFDGKGKPEPLSHEFSGKWSRRIDQEHRLVYEYDADNDRLLIFQCRYHY